MMKENKLYDNTLFFVLYGMINLLLLLFLLTLIILLFNDIYVLSRIGFVAFIGIHLLMLFFIKIHYVRIAYDEKESLIKFHYNKRFGIKWKQKAGSVLLRLKQLDGYTIDKDFMGNTQISFLKLEKKERYELGPFFIGFISKKEKQLLMDSFGESL